MRGVLHAFLLNQNVVHRMCVPKGKFFFLSVFSSQKGVRRQSKTVEIFCIQQAIIMLLYYVAAAPIHSCILLSFLPVCPVSSSKLGAVLKAYSIDDNTLDSYNPSPKSLNYPFNV